MTRAEREKVYPSQAQLRETGDRALARALARSKNKRGLIDAAEMWVEVDKMRERGYRNGDIAFALNRSLSYIELLVKRFASRTLHIPIAKDRETYDGTELDWNVNSFAAFFDRFSPYTFQPHQRPWVEAFLAHRNLILNVPPRHSKSTLFAVWLPLWLICRDRNTQVIIVSAANEDASKWALEIAGQMELNQDLIQTFGAFVPQNKGDFPWRATKGEFVVAGRTKYAKGAQFTLQVKGMSQHILGREADYVIVDDGINPEIAASETARKTNMDHLLNSVLTRVESSVENPYGGRACLIGQRVHSQDYYGVLAEQVYEKGPRKGEKVWHLERYPAVLRWPEDNDGQAEVLWEARWPFEELMESYARVGGFNAFSCMYQQEPLPQETALVKQVWWDSCKDRQRAGFEGPRAYRGDPAVARVLAIDPSPTQFHGWVLGDVSGQADARFRLDILGVGHMRSGQNELRELIRTMHGAYELDYLVWEDSTFSGWFFNDPYFHEIRTDFKIVKHKTTTNKHVADYGVQSLAWDFENRNISLPYGDAEGKQMTDGLGVEVLGYPEYPRDDQFMALWFIKFNWRRLKPMPEANPLSGYYGRHDGAWSWWDQMQGEQPVRDRFDRSLSA